MRRSARPNARVLAEQLREALDSAAVHREAVDRIKAFLLRLHDSAVPMTEALRAELSEIVSLVVNGDTRRPRGLKARRPGDEKKAIVAAYEEARRNGQFGAAAAVLRKYSIDMTQVRRWRRKLEAGESLDSPSEWLLRRDPFAEALVKTELPSPEEWSK